MNYSGQNGHDDHKNSEQVGPSGWIDHSGKKDRLYHSGFLNHSS